MGKGGGEGKGQGQGAGGEDWINGICGCMNSLPNCKAKQPFFFFLNLFNFNFEKVFVGGVVTLVNWVMWLKGKGTLTHFFVFWDGACPASPISCSGAKSAIGRK